MSYYSPQEEHAFQKLYNSVRKCPNCKSTNIEKYSSKDALGDRVVVAKCNNCDFDAELQVGFGVAGLRGRALKEIFPKFTFKALLPRNSQRATPPVLKIMRWI